VAPGQALLFCPLGGGMSDSIYTGSSADDHSGGSDAGVAYGTDPSGGKKEFQFGSLWVSLLLALARARALVCPRSRVLSLASVPLPFPRPSTCSALQWALAGIAHWIYGALLGVRRAACAPSLMTLTPSRLPYIPLLQDP
jgi:hypothetical protein